MKAVIVEIERGQKAEVFIRGRLDITVPGPALIYIVIKDVPGQSTNGHKEPK